ncbi:carboxymuconolactone decarboxylase family protein, partial [Dyella sp. EPa41]|uniref:carboxymuconolactone decarboxylase family protein n=1 Tax=Dyella sp. EPa41 TaxID=1561194 RepID=UPI001F268CBB
MRRADAAPPVAGFHAMHAAIDAPQATPCSAPGCYRGCVVDSSLPWHRELWHMVVPIAAGIAFARGSIMTMRLDYQKQAPDFFKKFADFSNALAHSAIDETTHDLVNVRASQINGCTFCLDMHVKEATLHGERALRLHHVAAWRESTLFTPRERAALSWTEVLTQLPAQG